MTHPNKMENQKVQLRMLCFGNLNKTIVLTVTIQKICSVYGEGMINDRAVRNWFVEFRSGDVTLKDEPRGVTLQTSMTIF